MPIVYRTILLLYGLMNVFAWREPVEEETSDVDNLSDYENGLACEQIYDILQLKHVEEELKKQGFSGQISFQALVEAIHQGNGAEVWNRIIELVKGYLFSDVSGNRIFMVELIAVALIGSVFVNLSVSFGSGFISENGFYVSYLIMTSLMLTSFSLMLEMVRSALEHLLALVQIIVPVYALAMNYIGHPATSAGMYEVIMVGIWIVQVLILRFILPMIQFYVIVSLVNHLNKEDSFSKLCTLIRSMVGWMLKTIVVFVAGLNVIKSLLEPQMDVIGRHAISRMITSVPGGGIVSVLTGTFLGAGVIIKNCIGIAGIIMILLFLLVPVFKAFLMMVTARLTAVIIQPIGEKRYVEGVESLATGMKLLLQAMGSAVVLFVLTIAIMAYVSSGG